MKTFAQPSSNLCGTLFSPSLVAQLLSAEGSRRSAGSQRVVSGLSAGAQRVHLTVTFASAAGDWLGMKTFAQTRRNLLAPLSATGHWRHIEFSVRSACALRADSVRSRPSVFASSRGIRST